MSRWHVVGAGLAGLAAATRLAGRGEAVILYEAAGHAGGRCRSFFDPRLGLTIDNGNHLILTGNRATVDYLRRIGGIDRLHELAPARFPFVDLTTGERWNLRPGRGPLPLWLADPRRRPPGMGAGDVGRGLGFFIGAGERSAGAIVGRGSAFDRFWDPLITAVLNTPPSAASAALMRPVLRETFARGERWCRPLIARKGLSDALVDPALSYLRRHGAELRFGARVSRLTFAGDLVSALVVDAEPLGLAADDRIVLATPPWVTAGLLAELQPPARYSPILNAHFHWPTDGPDEPRFVGLVGGVAQWIFQRGPLVSVTVSAAEAHLGTPAHALAERLWDDVRRALELGSAALPPHRLVIEKRATPLQTPAAARNRWPARTRYRNVALAGDWVATGLPATIESAVRSGEQAVQALLRRPRTELVGTVTQRTA